MEIKEFLELCNGKWFSQRTSYQLAEQKLESSKAEITIESLASDRPDVVKLCQQHQINPAATLGAMKTSWDNSADWGKPKQIGSTTLILAPDSGNPTTGKLLRAESVGQPSVVGHYEIGKDEALTLTVREGDRLLEERLWFASPNLRLRTSTIKSADRIDRLAFYSEIRKVAPPAQLEE